MKQTGNKLLAAFLVGGDPNMKACEGFAATMLEAGLDVLEIGIPFSDPVAEGVRVGDANQRALASGATIDAIFNMVSSIRRVSAAVITLYTYANPIFTYGYERFFARCREAGVTAVRISDMPFEEQAELRAAAAASRVGLIPVITPASPDRIRAIAAAADAPYIHLLVPGGDPPVGRVTLRESGAIIAAVREVCALPVLDGSPIPDPAANGRILDLLPADLIIRYGENAAPQLSAMVREQRR